ncbi:hypothetical protein TrST_g10230 [Triparma strigata]|uniref:Uncharacterized protein n=1 Tax=Triparma strigata TaxID=1606541 RepID=A0A9W7E9A7_9STRA|nr:hypothetical protein TrST_g10230 [Triparma strigata]
MIRAVIAASLITTLTAYTLRPPPKPSYETSTVLITGPSLNGIGHAFAQSFSSLRVSKIILLGRSLSKLEAARSSLPHPNVEIIQCDFSSPPSLTSSLQKIKSNNNRIDYLICNAGISQRSTFLETPLSTFYEIFQVNLFSHVALIHGLSSLMNLPGDNKSYIVYVSSVQSVIALPERSGYSASKAAVSGLCDSLRAEFSDFCNVIEVRPGYVSTSLSLNALTSSGKYNKTDSTTLNGIPPRKVAERVIEGIEKGESVIDVGWDAKSRVAVWLKFWGGGVLRGIMERRFRKSQREKVRFE